MYVGRIDVCQICCDLPGGDKSISLKCCVGGPTVAITYGDEFLAMFLTFFFDIYNIALLSRQLEDLGATQICHCS